MAKSGTWTVRSISDSDRSRAVKRALATSTSKVRITEGQRRTIVDSAKRKAH